MPNSLGVKYISECYIKPKYEVDDSKKPYILTHWDLKFLSIHYTQRGLLYPKPNEEEHNLDNVLESLKDSLAQALVLFYPLAGRLVTNVDEDKHRCTVHLDCNKGQGARFIHASLDVTVSDLLCSSDPPHVVHSLFDLSNGEVSYDGHTSPNLSIQVTVLIDDVFIGCSMNHSIADATSYWHFWNVWSEIQRAKGKSISISNPPIYERWCPEGYGPNDLFLPFTHPDEFITRYNPPQLTEKVFSFGLNEIQKLKSKANEDIKDENNKISSFQALAAFVWRCIICANGLKPEQVTRCNLAANNRSRVSPPLPPNYFGNSTSAITTSTTVGELLELSLGQVGELLNKSVRDLTGKAVIDNAQKWFESPFVYQNGGFIDPSANSTVYIVSSPRLDMYGNEFVGLGKPIAVRSGVANRFSGQVVAYAGNQGPGSVDFEISLTANCMNNLESDVEFMDVASSFVI